jgi:DinB superfamily
MIGRPAADEHAQFYAKYVTRVPDGDLVRQLREQSAETAALLRAVPADRADFAYEPGKWTIKEVIGHMADVERVMAYRAVRFARNDKTELPGFDENLWAANANFGRRPIGDLIDELEVVRSATIEFAKNLSVEEQLRRGRANGQEVSVRALMYIIAGHERHHVALLRDRYLSS